MHILGSNSYIIFLFPASICFFPSLQTGSYLSAMSGSLPYPADAAPSFPFSEAQSTSISASAPASTTAHALGSMSTSTSASNSASASASGSASITPFAEKRDFKGRTILVMAINGNYRQVVHRLLVSQMQDAVALFYFFLSFFLTFTSRNLQYDYFCLQHYSMALFKK